MKSAGKLAGESLSPDERWLEMGREDAGDGKMLVVGPRSSAGPHQVHAVPRSSILE